jgi:hypothetical protein
VWGDGYSGLNNWEIRRGVKLDKRILVNILPLFITD